MDNIVLGMLIGMIIYQVYQDIVDWVRYRHLIELARQIHIVEKSQ